MKNIHILPTDKPSIIGFDSVKRLHFTNDFIDDYQNIYITSDEEIKEGDWWSITERESGGEGHVVKHRGRHQRTDQWEKIILTTDQDLDDVQPIDDEFLEWYVKNPNCEEVQVIKTFEDYVMVGGKVDEIYYKLIIPKEESKQETLEKFIESYVNRIDRSEDGLVEQCLRDGAKWKQERSYSVEEVENIMAETWIQCVGNDGNNFKEVRDKILKQFKKK